MCIGIERMDSFAIICLLITGLVAGTMGGLLGIGGSVVVIPSLILVMSINGSYTGNSQHLIQAVGMICNFCVTLPAAIGHMRSGAVIKPIVISLVPSALVGILLGVSFSNIPLFAGENGKYLSLLLGCFLFYVACYNFWKLIRGKNSVDHIASEIITSRARTIFSGWLVGTIAGLLGIGGGSICVPCQQVFLRVPLKNAIANSSCTLVSMVLVGAIYKNATLAEHGCNWQVAVRLSIFIVPTAIVSSYLSSKLTHKINHTLLRVLFIVFMLTLSSLIFYKFFTN